MFLGGLVPPARMDNFRVREPLVLGDEVDDAHPKTRNPLVKPKLNNIIHFVPDVRVFPVQVGLERTKEGKIILIRFRVESPS